MEIHYPNFFVAFYCSKVSKKKKVVLPTTNL